MAKVIVLTVPPEPDDGMVWWASSYMHCWPAYERMPADAKSIDFHIATEGEIACAAALGLLPNTHNQFWPQVSDAEATDGD